MKRMVVLASNPVEVVPVMVAVRFLQIIFSINVALWLVLFPSKKASYKIKSSPGSVITSLNFSNFAF